MSDSNQDHKESAIKLRLPSDFKAEIEETASELRISVSALSRLALAEYIRMTRARRTEKVHDTVGV